MVKSIFTMSLSKREKGKKEEKSWFQLSKWISYHFLSMSYPTSTGCYFSFAHRFLFFQVSSSLLDPAHISVTLLFSYLVHMLKLYISAKFLEHLKSVAYNSAPNISSILCCCFLYFNPLTLLNRIANDIKLCEIANHRNTNYNSRE